jgi:hypothetical protein
VRAIGAPFASFNMVRPDGSLASVTKNNSTDVDRYNPDGSLR